MNKYFYLLIFLSALICNNINAMCLSEKSDKKYSDLFSLKERCYQYIATKTTKIDSQELLSFNHPDLKEKMWHQIKQKVLYPVILNKNIKTFSTTHGNTYDICVTKDGKIITAPETDNSQGYASISPTIPIWNFNGNQSATLEGHQGAIMSLVLKMHQEKEFLISASHDKTVKIWDHATNKCKWTSKPLLGQCNKLMMHENNILVSLFRDRIIYMFDFEAGQIIYGFLSNTTHAEQIFCNPHGIIMVGGSDGLFRYNLSARKKSKDILPYYRVCATSDPNSMLLADHTSLHLYDERMQKSFKDIKIIEGSYKINRLCMINNKIAAGIYPIFREHKDVCAHVKLIDQDLTQELMDIKITAPNNFVTSLAPCNSSHLFAGLYGKQNTLARICIDDTISAAELLELNKNIENKTQTKEQYWLKKQ